MQLSLTFMTYYNFDVSNMQSISSTFITTAEQQYVVVGLEEQTQKNHIHFFIAALQLHFDIWDSLNILIFMFRLCYPLFPLRVMMKFVIEYQNQSST